LHFDDLVGKQTMCFAMDCNGGFFVGSLNQAKDLTGIFVKPIIDVIDIMLV
jgi:hypothetical protein